MFEREHKNVLQAIKNLEVDEDFSRLNFQPTSYTDSFNRQQAMYMMTKKGYRRLVMDFTGKRASEVKEHLLDRFEELEEKESKPVIPALSGNIADMLQLAADQLCSKGLSAMALPGG